MLQLTLNQQICDFIKAFRVVKESHIRTFFSDCGDKNVTYEINKLKNHCWIFEHADGFLSTVRRLPTDLDKYLLTSQAVHVLSQVWKSKDITYLNSALYPVEIEFIEDDSLLFDITVFTESNFATKTALLKHRWSERLVDKESDPFNHIAVIPDERMRNRLTNYGFSYFIVIDRNGSCRKYRA